MKSTFQAHLVNPPYGDPALYVRLRWQGQAVLFDLGRIDRLDGSSLLRLTHVFVSHTHMDHFIGFDRLLRVFLARAARLHLYGPPGIIDNVRGSFQGIGKLGFLGVELENGTIAFDPSVRLEINISDPGTKEADGFIRFEEMSDITVEQVTVNLISEVENPNGVADLTIGGRDVPAGKYSLYTVRQGGQYFLIINNNTGQWGTEYSQAQDLGRIPMKMARPAASVEQFTIGLQDTPAGGTLTLEWADRSASVDFTVKN